MLFDGLLKHYTICEERGVISYIFEEIYFRDDELDGVCENKSVQEVTKITQF